MKTKKTFNLDKILGLFKNVKINGVSTLSTWIIILFIVVLFVNFFVFDMLKYFFDVDFNNLNSILVSYISFKLFLLKFFLISFLIFKIIFDVYLYMINLYSFIYKEVIEFFSDLELIIDFGLYLLFNIIMLIIFFFEKKSILIYFVLVSICILYLHIIDSIYRIIDDYVYDKKIKIILKNLVRVIFFFLVLVVIHQIII